MIALGVLLFVTSIGLIWFRTPLTRTRIAGQGDSPIAAYIVNEADQTTLLCIAGLVGMLGIGLIVAGIVRPKRQTQVDSDTLAEPVGSLPSQPVAPVYCSVCKIDVPLDGEGRCPTCGWPA